LIRRDPRRANCLLRLRTDDAADASLISAVTKT
jgi:hypothetical protein